MNTTVVLLSIDIAKVKSIPATIKQRSEPIHRMTLPVALSLDALSRTNRKFNTPKTTAKYNNNIASIMNNTGVPIADDAVSFISEPQLRVRSVLSVKSRSVIFCGAESTNGIDKV